MRSQSTPRSSTQYSPIAKRAKTESITSPSTQHHEHHASHVTGSSSNIVSIIQTMKHQEFTTYRQLPYLTNNVEVTRSDRHAMCQWGFSILDACKVDRHFAIVALTFFDRFLSCRGLRSVEACLARQREFQLAYITCLTIALKSREAMNITPTFAAETMCDGMYFPEEFVNLEIEILRALSWRLNGPTPQDFIQHFVELMPASADKNAVNMLVKVANGNAEIAMTDYDVAMESYSCIAIASIAAALRTVGPMFESREWMNRVAFVMSDALDE